MGYTQRSVDIPPTMITSTSLGAPDILQGYKFEKWTRERSERGFLAEIHIAEISFPTPRERRALPNQHNKLETTLKQRPEIRDLTEDNFQAHIYSFDSLAAYSASISFLNRFPATLLWCKNDNQQLWKPGKMSSRRRLEQLND